MQPSAKIKSIILGEKHALCVTTGTDRSKAHGQEHNARILAKLKLVCGGEGCGGEVVSALEFRTEGQWFDIQSLPLCLL